MADTTITVASFQNACAECADAISTDNWAIATKWYARAEAIHSGLALDISAEGTRTRRREALDGLRQAVDAAENAVNSHSGSDRIAIGRTRYNR